MPNGDQYNLMETEADRILYGQINELKGDVDGYKEDIKTVHRRMDAILVLLITVLGGIVYSLVGG